jgi:hypothetical protein
MGMDRSKIITHFTELVMMLQSSFAKYTQSRKINPEYDTKLSALAPNTR